MELDTIKSYLDKVFTNIPDNTFSPASVQDITKLLMEHFYVEAPYWTKDKEESASFYVKFKKYNKNGKTIYLCFFITGQEYDENMARTLTLRLCDARFQLIGDDERLKLAEVWRNRSCFYQKILSLINKGLDETEQDR
jgi:hypothetical protein